MFEIRKIREKSLDSIHCNYRLPFHHEALLRWDRLGFQSSEASLPTQDSRIDTADRSGFHREGKLLLFLCLYLSSKIQRKVCLLNISPAKQSTEYTAEFYHWTVREGLIWGGPPQTRQKCPYNCLVIALIAVMWRILPRNCYDSSVMLVLYGIRVPLIDPFCAWKPPILML